ncbi:BppU family phage baseplate upper protein [Staphylococcus nepalensis]|uniref:BppU family phage baseplate upper protein n=1 Tax=Staphylococcus nepalensis TaxID=214473 RepID=UPI000E05384B|nr:BppU family phage baseplate upper protein [Staphylococcus nepalensis]SUM69769.1 phage protein [Staphylococcus nepalensis]SUM96048.1 phage protein [Staphylococcus nepalensis]
MDNGIDKKTLFKLKSEPYLKPISDLGVGFYNLDENTAILRFQLYNDYGPLLIHKNNLTAYAYFESNNGSVSDVIELEVEDSNQGLVTITLDKDFLQASTSTKVTGQVYIGVNNVDNKPEYNEVAVFREFNFEVKDALINKISSFTKIEYIRMFDQLKTRIKQRVLDIEKAIANGEDYVAEMKSVLQKGVETLKQIVSDGKQDIQYYIEQAKEAIDTTQTESINTIEKLSQDTKDSVKAKADKAVESIETTTNTATEYVDDKLSEFNQSVEDSDLITNEDLSEHLDGLDWQKYKLTNDDGTRPYLLKGSFSSVHDLPTGKFETVGASNAEEQDLPSITSNAFIEIDVTESEKDERKQIYVLISYSKRLFLKTIHTNGSDTGWKELTQEISDTGWVPYNTINGVEKNAMFKSGDDNGFDCAYRIIKQGDITTRKLRVNARNLTNGVTFAELPSAFAKNYQKFVVATPRNKTTGIVDITPNGELKFNYYYNTADWVDTDYIYGEFTWHD